ncbi:MAG: hypothetical protein K2I38_02185, partial [Duncaniella sp.]|nr:hypothetical protein [Duncaniella sp.]
TECRVVADASTIGNEYPDLYLLFEPEMLGPDCADYAIYMSYSVADIFANPSCKGVTVHFNDPNISAQQITLNKLGSALTPSTRD